METMIDKMMEITIGIEREKMMETMMETKMDTMMDTMMECGIQTVNGTVDPSLLLPVR